MNSLRLNNIKYGKNTFCGPSALSSLIGLSTDEACDIIQSIRGTDDPVSSIHHIEFLYICYLFGIIGNAIPDGMSVEEIRKQSESNSKVISVLMDEHICLIQSGNYICNHTKVPVTIIPDEFSKRKVYNAFELSASGGIIPPKEIKKWEFNLKSHLHELDSGVINSEEIIKYMRIYKDLCTGKFKG